MKNSEPPPNIVESLGDRHARNLYRHLQLPTGDDFCSNDYLGFAQDETLQKRVRESLFETVSGSSGARLLRGHQKIFETLESELARFSERESALFFPSGYQANLGLLSALLDKDTEVFSDELNHASLIDGIKLSGATKKIFSHNDLDELEVFLQDSEADKKIIVIESLYSMTGDKAPIKDIIELAEMYSAQVVVDEAHATGVYGAGLLQKLGLQNRALASMHSAGKALGVAGAWVACDNTVKEFLINFSRPFIYSTAPSPLVATALLTSLAHWEWVGAERAEVVLDKAASFTEKLKVIFAEESSIWGEGAIIYINLKDSEKAVSWSQVLQEHGYDIRAIRYPTVKENQAGLRISIHANHSWESLEQLLTLFKKLVIPC